MAGREELASGPGSDLNAVPPDNWTVSNYQLNAQAPSILADTVALVLRLAKVKTIPVRELRNNVSAVLRDVESGERFTVTANGREVARLVPLDERPTFRPWAWFLESRHGDQDLLRDIADAVGPETTDDVEMH